jgi:hypothetical protein
MRKRADDKCECGARETMTHVFIDCPKLRTARQKFRDKTGKRFNSISLILGGKPHNLRTVAGGKWTITKKELEAALEFAEETQRFISRVTNEGDTQSTATSTATRSIMWIPPSSQ